MWWEKEQWAEKAKKIRLVAFDVDGVCTDGRIYYGAQGQALHAFHARDGMGLVLARKNQLITAALSGRKSEGVQARLSELKVPHIHLGVFDKPAVLDEIRAHYGLDWSEVAFVGDDVNDLEVLKTVGLSVVVADAAYGLKDHAQIQLAASGGRGALRELIEGILRCQKNWPFG